ncbi:MAG: helix-turn-helix transcriptional regulator [Clostridiales bacterium]|jgi:ArsR family transcriptional regulator|nr:helix-turn-helix transcriptional regulator [Clostridiales bacterium]
MNTNDGRFTGALNILSENVRFRILSLIASKGELTAKEILSEFDFTQPTLSHHMACLTEAGLVNVERRGRFAYYSVNNETIDFVISGISSLRSSPKKPSGENDVTDADNREMKKGKKKKKKDKNKKKKKD